jgi:hypothetical protein
VLRHLTLLFDWRQAVGSAGGAPCSPVGRATGTSTPPRSSRWAAKRPTCRTHLLQPRRPLGCGLLPNKAWCRNSGRNEIESDNRCRRRARKSSAHRRAGPALSDNSHRNGNRCRCGAGTPCSGTDKLDPVHPWQLLEASRSGIARSVPPPPPNLVGRILTDPVGSRRAAFPQKGLLVE